MEKRYIYTKVWEDDFFSNLSRAGKLLFLYSFTNQKIGYTGYFEATDRVICFDTGLTIAELADAKQEIFPKVLFHQSWVYVPNAGKFEPIRGENNPLWKAHAKELVRLPEEIKEYFEGALKGLPRPSEGSLGIGIGIKGESVREEKASKKSLTGLQKSLVDNLPEAEIKNISARLKVKPQVVRSYKESYLIWIQEKPQDRSRWDRSMIHSVESWLRRDITSGKVKTIQTLEEKIKTEGGEYVTIV